jgi:hypothetical protein
LFFALSLTLRQGGRTLQAFTALSGMRLSRGQYYKTFLA